MNNYNDNNEDEALSLEEPIDWYYDKVAEHGYATECVILIFSEYVRHHNLILKICGVSFDDLRPMIESEGLRVEIIESNDSYYAEVKLHTNPEMPDVSSLRMQYNCDFAFAFFELDSNGDLIELDYSDDYEMK